MKKITLLRANKTKFGGGENYLSRLVDELREQGVDCEVIHSTIPKFISSWLRAIIFNITACLNKKDNFYFSLERITCPDIYRAGDGVHKVFMQIENKSIFRPLNIVYLYLEKYMFNNAKAIVAISNMVKNDIINTYSINPNKIKVIYNGIKLQKIDFNNSYKKIFQEFNINSNENIFLYVGSGFKRKGVKEFIQILSKIKHKKFKAFIIGKEKNLYYYKKLSNNLGLSDKIIFTGPRADVNNFYTISDIFLFPTRYEPFGNVILEAMNFKNAIITTKFCGGGEILNKQFIMKTPQDYSIADKIDELLDNPQKLHEIKEENYKNVQNFTIEKNARKTMELINEYLN